MNENNLEKEFNQIVESSKDKLMDAQSSIMEAIRIAKEHKFWLNEAQMDAILKLVNDYESVRSWINSGCANY